MRERERAVEGECCREEVKEEEEEEKEGAGGRGSLEQFDKEIIKQRL